MSIERIGLVTHGGKEAAVSTAEDVRRWAADHEVTCADIDIWGGAPRRSPAEEAERAGRPDLIVTVGGDGTFLRGSRVAIPLGALILGVNVGRVGFLTDVSVAEVSAALEAVRSGSYRWTPASPSLRAPARSRCRRVWRVSCATGGGR